jgi:hypothetical protein
VTHRRRKRVITNSETLAQTQGPRGLPASWKQNTAALSNTTTATGHTRGERRQKTPAPTVWDRNCGNFNLGHWARVFVQFRMGWAIVVIAAAAAACAAASPLSVSDSVTCSLASKAGTRVLAFAWLPHVRLVGCMPSRRGAVTAVALLRARAWLVFQATRIAALC